jgi:hypothetical protein
MSAQPATGCNISSEHFERNPRIEDSVTKSHKDKANAVGPLFSMSDYDDGPGKEQPWPKRRKPKADFHCPHQGCEDTRDDASSQKTDQP